MTDAQASRHGIQVLDRADRLLARLEASSEPLALTTLCLLYTSDAADEL